MEATRSKWNRTEPTTGRHHKIFQVRPAVSLALLFDPIQCRSGNPENPALPHSKSFYQHCPGERRECELWLLTKSKPLSWTLLVFLITESDQKAIESVLNDVRLERNILQSMKQWLEKKENHFKCVCSLNSDYAISPTANKPVIYSCPQGSQFAFLQIWISTVVVWGYFISTLPLLGPTLALYAYGFYGPSLHTEKKKKKI